MTTSDGGDGSGGSTTCSGSGGGGESLLCSSHAEDRLWGAVEILPQRLYYAPLRFFPPLLDEEEIEEDDSEEVGNAEAASSTTIITSSRTSKTKQQQSNSTKTKLTEEKKKKMKKPIHYFSIDNELVYWNFFLDFGPLNLGHLYRFCEMLNDKLNSPTLQDHIICYYSGAEGTKRANATYLICAYQMLYLGRTLEESYFGFEPAAEEDEGARDDECNKRRRRMKTRKHRVRTSWSHAAMAALANADDEEMLLSNVSLPPQQKPMPMVQPQQHRRHFPHRLLTSGSDRSNTKNSGGAGKSASQSAAKNPFVPIHPLPPYHDASPIICTYDLTVSDCLAGLQKARQFGFFDFGNAAPPTTATTSITTTTTTTTTTAPTTTADVMGNNDNYDEENSTAAATATSATLPPLFDIDEYEHFEQVENGDLNWIIARKILAFAGPLTKKSTSNDDTNNTEGMYYNLTPTDYIPYFHKRNVQLVIRLNNASCYDATEFTRAGIQHVTHYYMDGSCPTIEILFAVVADMERVINRDETALMMMMELEEEEEEGGMNEAEGEDDDDDNLKQTMVDDTMEIGKQGSSGGGRTGQSSREGGAVAVHCKAGLGRTGTCIGAYIMKHYKFTAAEVIGYMRICRPGMVIGPQQHFLASIESLMWQEGDLYRMTIERLRGITASNKGGCGGDDGGGLRKMSIDSNNGGGGGIDDEEEGDGRQQLHQHATATPQAKTSSEGGVGGGALVSIVTPDGQPFRLLTTPVNARKMHINSSLVQDLDPSPISSPAMLQPRPIPLSTNNEESKVALIDVDLSNDNIMQEGDQANELLSRRMNRHQVQHQST